MSEHGEGLICTRYRRWPANTFKLFFFGSSRALYAMMHQHVFDGCTIAIGLEKEFRPIVVAF